MKRFPLRYGRRFVFSLLLWMFLALAHATVFGSSFVNLSVRANVGTGNNVAIAGTIIQGSGAKTVVIRGLGPSVPLAGRLANPYLTLYNGNGVVIAQNDNWKSTQQSQIAATGLAPSNDLESAIYASLAVGNYSAILTGVSQTTGIGLLEIYDVSAQPAPSTLANLAGRANVGVGNNVEIAGFIIGGSGTRPLVIRALGPTIPLSGTLADPFLTLYNASGGIIYQNNNWQDSQAYQISHSGLAPTNVKESAIYAVLSPGTYSAAVSGVGNTTGIANLELYTVAAQPTPTPTPVPQRLLWQDSTDYIRSVGYSQPPGGEIVALATSNLLTPLAPGNITVHADASAYGTCTLGCPPFPPNAYLYAEVLNSAGAVVGIINLGGLGMTSGTFTGSYSNGISSPFTNPFKIRMMCSSQASFPAPDKVTMTYYDVYAP